MYLPGVVHPIYNDNDTTSNNYFMLVWRRKGILKHISVESLSLQLMSIVLKLSVDNIFLSSYNCKIWNYKSHTAETKIVFSRTNTLSGTIFCRVYTTKSKSVKWSFNTLIWNSITLLLSKVVWLYFKNFIVPLLQK